MTPRLRWLLLIFIAVLAWVIFGEPADDESGLSRASRRASTDTSTSEEQSATDNPDSRLLALQKRQLPPSELTSSTADPFQPAGSTVQDSNASSNSTQQGEKDLPFVVIGRVSSPTGKSHHTRFFIEGPGKSWVVSSGSRLGGAGDADYVVQHISKQTLSLRHLASGAVTELPLPASEALTPRNVLP